VDLKQLKDIMNREVLDSLDHRFLNKEVLSFATRFDHRKHCYCRLAAPGLEAEKGPVASRASV
jgi:6-pyruvoyl-tetrahydropterin synthase